MKSESSQKMAISFPSNIKSEMMMEWSGFLPVGPSPAENQSQMLFGFWSRMNRVGHAC